MKKQKGRRLVSKFNYEEEGVKRKVKKGPIF